MRFAEIVRVGEEGGAAEIFSDGGVVGPGVGDDGVPLEEHFFGEELTKVAEADDGDLEAGGLGEERGGSGFVVEGLGGVQGADRVERRAGAKEREGGWRGGERKSEGGGLHCGCLGKCYAGKGRERKG